jgi:hypothetical protein
MQEYRFVFFYFLISIGATVIINFRYSILIFIILSRSNVDNKLQNENKILWLGPIVDPIRLLNNNTISPASNAWQLDLLMD